MVNLTPAQYKFLFFSFIRQFVFAFPFITANFVDLTTYFVYATLSTPEYFFAVVGGRARLFVARSYGDYRFFLAKCERLEPTAVPLSWQ